MKKILFILGLVVSVAAYSQTDTISNNDSGLETRQKLNEDILKGNVQDDTIDVLRVDINKNVDSLAVHLDTAQAVRSDVNTNTATGSTNATNISDNAVAIGTKLSKTDTTAMLAPYATDDTTDVIRTDLNTNTAATDLNTAKETNTDTQDLGVSGNNITLTDGGTADVSSTTAVGLNTAKATNATHSSEVTGSGALTIADGVIEAANMEATNSPTDNYIPSYDQSSLGFTWVLNTAGLSESEVSDIVEDSINALIANGETGLVLGDSVGTAAGTYITGSDGADLEAMLQDTLGVVFVESYGAVGDDATDCTAAFEDALDAAGNYGTVMLGRGIYRVDSILIDKSQSLIGHSRGLNGSTISAVRGMKNNPVIYKWPDGAGYNAGYGGSIEKLTVLGSASADSSEQHGIMYDGANPSVTRDVYIYGVGGYGIYLAKHANTDSYTFENIKIQHCHLGGVRGSGVSTGNQLNAITFDKVNLTQNYGYGYWITGTNINIINGVIQSNDSTGIYLSNYGLEASSTSSNILIQGNYFEQNGGGEIYGEVDNDGTYYHIFINVEISNNYFNSTSTQVDKPEVTASIMFDREPGSNSIFYWRDLFVGQNAYNVTGMYCLDANDVLDTKAVVTVDYSSAISSWFVDLGTAAVDWMGVRQGGIVTIPHVAITGIPETSLAPKMYLAQASAINITANPQIVAGAFSGQTITIIGNSDSNTLTLDQSNGIWLDGAASWVGGYGDLITLIFSSTFNVWIEQSRADN